MNDENFSQGSNGPYNIKPAIDDQTYCNYATYQVVSRTNPQMLKFMVNKEDLTGKNTRASEAGTNLKNAASDSSTGIKEIDCSTAQLLANNGYTVIGVIVDGVSHIATVRPGWNNSSSRGPMTANVGIKIGTKTLRSSIAFDEDYWKGNVHFYYDSKQVIEK